MLREVKEARAQLKHDEVAAEKMKMRVAKSKSRLGSISPITEMTPRSKSKTHDDKSFTKLSKGDVSADGDATKLSLDHRRDSNLQAVVNRRRSVIKEKVTKLTKELENEEMELKGLTTEIQQ